MTETLTRALIAVLNLGTVMSVQAQAVNYQVDPSHTWVGYEVLHFGTSTSRGRIPVKGGAVQIDAQARAGKVEIEIDTAAPSSGVPVLDRMLQGERFFRAGEFPTARFVSNVTRFDADRPMELQGELTLLGTTRPVTLKATRYGCYQNSMLKREVCGGDFETAVRRSQWGMDWGMNIVSDEVRLLVQVEAIKQN